VSGVAAPKLVEDEEVKISQVSDVELLLLEESDHVGFGEVTTPPPAIDIVLDRCDGLRRFARARAPDEKSKALLNGISSQTPEALVKIPLNREIGLGEPRVEVCLFLGLEFVIKAVL